MEAVKKPFKQLVTPDQAQRAIYIDFEGFEEEPPSLFGWVWAIGKKATDSNLACVQDIHDKSLQRLVGAAEIPEGSVNRYKQRPFSVGQAINELVRLADKQDRLIVSWSTHEKNEIEKIGLSPDLLCIFNRNYRDGKVTAIEWLREATRWSAISNRLATRCRATMDTGRPRNDSRQFSVVSTIGIGDPGTG